MSRRLFAAVVLVLFGLVAGGVHAQNAVLPDGIERDSSSWLQGLTKAFPAGGNAKSRADAEQAAAAAVKKNDTKAEIAALERRVGLGQPSMAHFLALSAAYGTVTPKDFQRSLFAATRALSMADQPQDRLGPLLAIADALQGLKRDVQAIPVMLAAVEAAPADPDVAHRLAELRESVGMRVLRVRREGESDPPRACIEFTVPLSKRGDFQPQDWVTISPAIPSAAVTREDSQLCVSGLPSAATTRLTVRAGMPADFSAGAAPVALKADEIVNVSMPKRNPRIDFDTRMFVLPRGQVPASSLSTVNVSSVSLSLVRLTERNIPLFLQNYKLGQAVPNWTARDIAENTGRAVWAGRADIPGWEANRVIRTALPMPEEMRKSGPGLYALIATPGDGTSGDAASVQIILNTDIAPSVWRGSDGLTVQLRSYADAQAQAGVRLVLLARNNDILAEAATDADGVVRFAAPLLRGQGPLAPAVLHAFGKDDDFAALDLSTAAFDLSDRGVEGQAHPGPVDSYVWTDRGIYRAGETVNLMALVRDAAGAPLDLPVRITVRRPNGQVFIEGVPPRGADAAVYLPITLTSSAPAGTWSAELRTDPTSPPIGRVEFKVDAFVPDRLAVEPAALPAQIGPDTAPLAIAARFLYGAPAANMTASATFRLMPDAAAFPALVGWKVGLVGEAYAPEERKIAIGDTDENGRTELSFDLGRLPDTTMPLKAAFDVAINDPAGRGANARFEIPVRPAGNLIGVKPVFADDAIDAGAEAAFDIAAFAPTGARTALRTRIRLVRERPDWRLISRNGQASYATVWKDEPLETKDVEIPVGGAFRFASKLDFGRYRLEVSEAGGMAATSYRFRAGWAGADSPDIPDRVDVSTDRRAIAIGGTAKVHIAPPFAGEATILVLSDRVLSLRTIAVAAGGTDIDVPVTEAWGPGAYVAVHVFRAGAGARPGRAIGLAWVATDASARKLDAAIEAPKSSLPRGKVDVAVRTAPGAWVSLAAIDEGIVRLTRFASPDPVPHFLGRRRIGIDIRDDWGRLIAPPDGLAAVLRQGGDENGMMPRSDPNRTVTKFFPAVQADAEGRARFPLEIGDFAGEVRFMAVAWQGKRIGAANAAMTVRDPLVADVLLPSHLAPGDEARLTVLLHNLDLPAGTVTAELATEGAVSIAGTARFSQTMATGAQALPNTLLKATGIGSGTVTLTVTGPNNFKVVHTGKVHVAPARDRVVEIAGAEVAPGAERRLAPETVRFIPGTFSASVTLGGRVRYSAASLIAALDAYGFSCLEQATSRGLPLALLPDGPMAGPDRAARLQQAVDQVLDRQRYDGAFALWRATGEGEPWLSSYATEFLLRARKAGATVPDVPMAEALKHLSEEAANQYRTGADEISAQAYRLYVLALAGQGRPGAARILAETPNRVPTPLARAQIAAALALAGDKARAEPMFVAALDGVTRTYWAADYGSALRDRAAIAVLLGESGLLPQRLATLIGLLPGAELKPEAASTQEQAWLAAASAVLGKGLPPVAASLDGVTLAAASSVTAPLPAPAVLRNAGTAPLWQSVSVTGVPITAPPASASQMDVRRKFFSAEGKPLDPRRIRQNTSFVMLLEARGPVDDQPSQIALTQGLPAGWEIVGRFGEGAIETMPWLGELSATDTQPALEDRFAAVGRMKGEQRDFRVAVKLRAVFPGSFEMPGASVANMYRPALGARLATDRVVVAAP